MKRAGPEALDGIEELLVALRERAVLTERKRGIFYLRSKAFLHFHEDPTGMHADLLVGGDVRLRAQTRAEWRALLKHVDNVLKQLGQIR